MKQFSLLLLLSAFSMTGLMAQDDYRFSLSEAVQAALQHNPSLKATALEQELNRYQKKEHTAHLLPTVSASAGATHFIDQQTTFLPANFLNPQAEAGTFIQTQFGLPNSGNVALSGQWMLYNQAVFNGYKLLQTRSELTEIQLEKEKDQLAYTVSQLYYGIAFARQQQVLLVQNIESLERLLATLESQFQNGLIKRVERDKVAVSKVNLESQAANLANVIETQENLFKLFLGLPGSATVSLTDRFDESVLRPLPNEAVVPERTLDYSLLNKQMELNLLEKKNLRASQLPTLGLVYNYSYNWTGEELGTLFSSELQYPMQYVGLSLNVPIFSGGRTQAKVHQNQVKGRQLQYQADFLQDKLATEIVNARGQYNQNVNALSARQANVDVAGQVYAQTVLEYEQGLLPLAEVLNQETALREAQTQYLSAISQALLALLEYQQAAGTLRIH